MTLRVTRQKVSTQFCGTFLAYLWSKLTGVWSLYNLRKSPVVSICRVYTSNDIIHSLCGHTHLWLRHFVVV